MIHKGVNSDPTVLKASEVLIRVLENSTKALSLEGRIGVIQEGAYADLVFLDQERINYEINRMTKKYFNGSGFNDRNYIGGGGWNQVQNEQM